MELLSKKDSEFIQWRRLGLESSDRDVERKVPTVQNRDPFWFDGMHYRHERGGMKRNGIDIG